MRAAAIPARDAAIHPPRRAPIHATRPFGVGAVLIGAGLFVVIGAFGAGTLSAGTGGFPLYCFALLYLALLLWWESTGSASTPSGVLPRWVSPPALICAWTLAWIYLPAVAAFFDDRLIDEYVAGYGGEALLVSGLLLACGAVTALSLFYHSATGILRARHVTLAVERHARLPRIIGLYLVSTAARTLRIAVLGVAFGQDRSAWGSLAWADQWVGYIEDLRYLALVLLVMHVIRQASGRGWLLAALLVEAVYGATSGYFKPLIWPLLLCVVAAAVVDRIKGRHVAAVAAGAVLVAFLSPAVVGIRESRAGALGTGGTDGVNAAFAALRTQGAIAAVESVYLKFFGRQTEIATSTGLVQALTPVVVPYEGVEQFLSLPLKLIPRAIWVDKPVLSRGQWFSVTFRGLEENTTSSSAMTIFGESYLFFGWTGVILGMFIAGTSLAALHRYLDRPGVAAVYLALIPTILEIEPELSSYFTSLLQRSIVFIVVFVVLTHRSKAV